MPNDKPPFWMKVWVECDGCGGSGSQALQELDAYSGMEATVSYQCVFCQGTGKREKFVTPADFALAQTAGRPTGGFARTPKEGEG